MNNMYDWIDNTRNFIGGECPHKCSYCYVKSSPYPVVRERYSGKIRLFENEFKKPLKSKSGKPIFIGSCFDMWADAVPAGWINRVIDFCWKYKNKYVFQTKNPKRFCRIVPGMILGTTIETNRDYKISKAPDITSRLNAMYFLNLRYEETFITIEPILDFDLDKFVEQIKAVEPLFINIGADSKKHNLPEPSWDKVEKLITELRKFTTVNEKPNLARLRKQHPPN